MANSEREAKLKRLKEIAEKGALESRHDTVREFFERMETQQVPIFEDFHAGIDNFYQAPRSQALTDMDIACVGVPFEVSAPIRAGTRFGPKSAREWSNFGVRCMKAGMSFRLIYAGLPILAMLFFPARMMSMNVWRSLRPFIRHSGKIIFFRFPLAVCTPCPIPY